MKKLLIMLLLATPALALTEGEILSLSKKEPSKVLELPEEMKLFDSGVLSSVRLKIHFPKGVKGNHVAQNFDKRFVEGYYFVSELTIKGDEHDFEIINVTSYSAEELCYVRWVLNKHSKQIFHYKGIRVGGSNTIAWTLFNPEKNGYNASFSTEKHEENKITWTQRDYKDDKLVFSMTGSASSEKLENDKMEDGLEAARKNARDALNKAIIELQKQLGDDKG